MPRRGFGYPYIISAIILGHFNQIILGLDFQTKFTMTYNCIDHSCVFEAFGETRSRISCSSKCSNSKTCTAVKYFPNDTRCVFLHQGCLNATKCPRSDEDLQVYEKKMICLNGGAWDYDLQICRCVNFWVGQICERRPYSCGELYSYWYDNGAYSHVPVDIYRNGSRVVQTNCRITANTVFTYIFDNRGEQDHNATWQNYADGYFVDSGCYWLGLENIRAFNRMGHNQVGVFLNIRTSDGTETGIWRYRFKNFNIQDAINGYKISCDPPVKSSQGSLAQGYEIADVLGMSQGVPFSAPDWDRDNDADHCASKAGRGWWFNTCHPSKDMNTSINLLGWNYRVYPGPPTDQHIWIPGVDMTDPVVMNAFRLFSFFFQDTSPPRL